LLVAATKDAVDRLGRCAQDRLDDAGRLGRRVAHTESGPLHNGDRVLATRNDRRIRVRNGQRGTIFNGSSQGDLLVVFDNDDRETRLPKGFVTSHLRQGYAITTHRAQGTTVDWALALIDGTWYRELGYSALSRARHGTELYLTGIEASDPIDHHPLPPAPEPLSSLARQLGQSGAEEAALSALPELADLGDPATARRAWDELEFLTARLAGRQGVAAPEAEPAATAMRNSEQDQQRLREQRRLQQLEGQLQYRETLLGIAVRYQRPEWAAELLGPLPTSHTGETAWLSTAGVVAAYLERWNPPDDPAPPASLGQVRRRHDDRVERALRSLRTLHHSQQWPRGDDGALSSAIAREDRGRVPDVS
jgi:hypothetical protein